jgi:hypothetical protein
MGARKTGETKEIAMLIVNQKTFRGVFPRKGTPHAKFETPDRGVVWLPTHGSEVVLAESVSAGQGYIHRDHIAEESLEGLPPWAGQLVWPYRHPGHSFLLIKDWTTEDWKLEGIAYNTIPAGCRVLADNTADGEPSEMDGGRWWVF